MTFTYSSTNLSTDLAQVRRLISDTDSANAIFTDEEINFFLTTGGNVYRAAAMAARAIAGSKALLAKRLSLSTYSEDNANIVTELLDLANTWERMAAAQAGTVGVTRVDAHSNTINSRTR